MESKKLAIVIACLVFTLGSYADADKTAKAPTGTEVIRLMERSGIPAEKATFLHREKVGHSPQIPVDTCYYHVDWHDARWLVGIDADKRRVVFLTGDAIVPEGKSVRVGDHKSAIRQADIWFRRFGVDIAANPVTDVKHEARGSWHVQRDRLLSPGVYVRVGAAVEVEGDSGGLVGFSRDPELPVPRSLPQPKVSRKEAVELALKAVSTTDSEHFKASSDAHLLDCKGWVTWGAGSDSKFGVRRVWLMRLYGHAEEISHLPEEFRKNAPPETVSVLWNADVDASTGAVDVHWVEQRNEAFVNGEVRKW